MMTKSSHGLARMMAVSFVFGPLLLASCTSGTDAPSAGSEQGSARASFWASHSASIGLEADPPATLNELTDRSDVVALAEITGVTEGRDYTDPGKPPNRTSNLSLSVGRVVGVGKNSGTLTVEFSRSPLTTLESVAASLPHGQFVFYLKPWYNGEAGTVYRCTSTSRCVLGAERGQVATPRGPVAASELALPQGLGAQPLTVDQLFDESQSRWRSSRAQG